MRAFAEPFFERSPYMLGPLVALVLFSVVFGAVVVYVLRSKHSRFDAPSQLPLLDDDQVHPATTIDPIPHVGAEEGAP